MPTLLDAVRATIHRHAMIRRGDSVLVAVSGGPDSLALLSALVALRREWRLALRAAYVDHGLRPAAARREAAFVRKVGRLWGVLVHVLRRKVRRGPGESLEAAARQARYSALASLAERTRSTVLALGHTQDDQAETVLMWILRGAGTTGLAGIPPVRELHMANGKSQMVRRGKAVRVIRPLLDCSRDEVERYLCRQGLRPLLDRSNRSDRFLRNRVRRQLIPLLEREYSPKLRRRLADLAEILREDLGWMEAQLKRLFRVCAKVRGGRVRLDRARLRGLAPAARRGILRLSVQKIQGDASGFRRRHWAELERLLLDGDGVADLPRGFRAEASARCLEIKAALDGEAVLQRERMPPLQEKRHRQG